CRFRLADAPGVHPMDPYAGLFARRLRIPKGGRVLDLGCGTGAYALAAKALGAGEVVVTDVARAAVACALGNARRNGLAGFEGRVGDLYAPVRGERFDVIVTSV